MAQPPPMQVWAFAGPAIQETILRLVWGLILYAQRGGRLDQVSLTSWWRSPEVNRDAGGDEKSGHLMAVAFDLFPHNRLLEASMSESGLHTVLGPRGNLHVQLVAPPILDRLGLLEAARQIGAVTVA